MASPAPHRRRLTSLVAVLSAIALLGVLACSSEDAADSSTTTAGQADAPAECDGTSESPDTRFVVDRCGRVVMLRGVNVESASKGDRQEGDHLPASGLDGQSELATWGWNTVRFLVFWGAIEPKQDEFSEEYLDGVQEWLDWYAEHDIHVVLDMHQDLYAWKVGFDGAPDWAVDTRGAEVAPRDADAPWFLAGADPAVQNAYQSFWNPLPGQPDLQSEWLDALANAFPYPGDLVVEDLVDPRDGPPRLSYAGHLYEQSVHDGGGYSTESSYVEEWERYRTEEAARLRGVLWFGEWGGAPDQDRMADYIAEVTAMADRQMAGWAWWSWDPGGWSPVESDGVTVSPNGTALLRVQPRAIAGTPTEFAWDPDDRVFEMGWTGRDDARGPTELAVPALLFDEGIRVVLDGTEVASPSWDRERSVLELDPSASAAAHTVCVEPATSSSCE